MVWKFVSHSQNSHVEIQMPVVMVLGSGAFGKWLGHEVKPSWMGLVSTKEIPDSSLAPSNMQGHSE